MRGLRTPCDEMKKRPSQVIKAFQRTLNKNALQFCQRIAIRINDINTINVNGENTARCGDDWTGTTTFQEEQAVNESSTNGSWAL